MNSHVKRISPKIKKGGRSKKLPIYKGEEADELRISCTRKQIEELVTAEPVAGPD